MLNEERKTIILQTIEKNGSASVQDLMQLLNASESTIRRDLTELDRRRMLVKVHGGAIAISDLGTDMVVTADMAVAEREELNRDKKIAIARYAAEMIQEDDVVFLDAGTTTGFVLDYLSCKETIFVTNAISHARKLCQMGMHVFMPGGYLKNSTEALIGAVACQSLEHYHFTKGFFGTNGVTRREGCTTPDAEEAAVKEKAFNNCRECYVLADSSKFGKISTVTFAGYSRAIYITDAEVAPEWKNEENIISV